MGIEIVYINRVCGAEELVYRHIPEKPDSNALTAKRFSTMQTRYESRLQTVGTLNTSKMACWIADYHIIAQSLFERNKIFILLRSPG